LAQVSLHDEAGAFESWTKALTLDAKQYDTLFNLAVLAGRLGKTEEARHALQRFIATAPPDRYSGRIQEARRLLGSLPRTAG
jgi:TolA-binding protein